MIMNENSANSEALHYTIEMLPNWTYDYELEQC